MGRARGHDHAAEGPARRRPTRRVHGGQKSWFWDDERLLGELTRFCSDRKTFPSGRDFDRAGRADLRRAVVDYGGTAYWAQQVGLPLGPRQDRDVYTLQHAIQEAKVIVATVGELPSVPRLRAMGYNRLATRVQEAGGAKRFRGSYLEGS